MGHLLIKAEKINMLSGSDVAMFRFNFGLMELRLDTLEIYGLKTISLRDC